MFCTDERAFIDIRVDFDIRVVGELESILDSVQHVISGIKVPSQIGTYPLAIINRHSGL